MTVLADPAAAGTDEDVIEIDGEEYSKSSLDDVRNNENWSGKTRSGLLNSNGPVTHWTPTERQWQRRNACLL